MKKTRDPYPITDVYFLEMNAVDAATVTVGDLCERLTNDFATGWGFGGPVKEFIDDFKVMGLQTGWHAQKHPVLQQEFYPLEQYQTCHRLQHYPL